MTPSPPTEATTRLTAAAPVVLPAARRTRRWDKAYAMERIRQALALEGDTAQALAFDVDAAARVYKTTGWLYRRWFRTECHGIEKLPPGRVMLVANHGSHALAFDGASILTACLFEAEPPRIVRPMADHRLMELPNLGKSAKRIGAVDGRPTSCINLLRDGAAVLTFPEGTRAQQRRFRDRYKLAPFGYGFARVALLARAPIVPVAVIGCEEEAPLLANPRWLRRLVGTHSAPITPTLVFPLPAKHRLWFGDPIHLTGPITSGTVSTGVRLVREALANLVAHGLAAREHVFW
jgi:1-acyl-sn-glycerol-3-phosphate acyltransferase